MQFIESLEARRLLSLTHVGISGQQFQINSAVTLPGSMLQGLLPNVRTVNATFDDANSATRGNWNYPDTHTWDPERNVNEFIAAVPSYHAKGVLAVTLSFQGGLPKASGAGGNQSWDNTAFTSDGTLKSDYASRMKRALQALDASGMIAFVQYFYYGQDQRLANEAAVLHATDQATDFLLANDFTNVIVDVANESGISGFDYAILNPPRVTELINRVRTRSGGKLLVGTSLAGGKLPDSTLISASDVVLLHGNGQNSSQISAMVANVRSRTSKPIVFNEDSTNLANFDAATAAGASWGYYDQGSNNYQDGFQSVPARWAINTTTKQAFFNRVFNESGLAGKPLVTSSIFNYSTGHSLALSFSTNVGASVSNADLVLSDLDAHTTVAASKIAVSYNGSTNTATFTFPGFAGGILPDANYEAVIRASQVTDANNVPLAWDSVTDFFVYTGDANHDRVVDTLDFNVLAANFGKSGRSFVQGNFNYSGAVDSLDYSLLVARFSKTFAAPTSAAALDVATLGPLPQDKADLLADADSSVPVL